MYKIERVNFDTVRGASEVGKTNTWSYLKTLELFAKGVPLM
jgi:hypothetical protein